MKTKNLDLYKITSITTSQTGNSNVTDNLPESMIDIDNNSFTTYCEMSGTSNQNYQNRTLMATSNVAYDVTPGNSSLGCFLWVGTGTSDPAETDYALTPIATAALTLGSFTASRSVSNGKTYITFSRTFTANEPITITEVGLLKGVYTSVGVVHNFLLAREKVTATSYAANELFTITFVLEID